jgi:hypothetical protein
LAVPTNNSIDIIIKSASKNMNEEGRKEVNRPTGWLLLEGPFHKGPFTMTCHVKQRFANINQKLFCGLRIGFPNSNVSRLREHMEHWVERDDEFSFILNME